MGMGNWLLRAWGRAPAEEALPPPSKPRKVFESAWRSCGPPSPTAPFAERRHDRDSRGEMRAKRARSSGWPHLYRQVLCTIPVQAKASGSEFGAGMKFAVEHGRLSKHESGTYVKLMLSEGRLTRN
jgi:hypothetical protein